MAERIRQYVGIDAKSFYASVECVERHLNPLTTNLVVADESRTEKTICLAVSPSLKAQKVSGRPRLFEVIQRVKEVNRERLNAGIRSGAIKRNPETNKYSFSSSSFDISSMILYLFFVFFNKNFFEKTLLFQRFSNILLKTFK